MKKLIGFFLILAIIASFGVVSLAQSSGGESFNTQNVNAQGYVDNNLEMSTEQHKMTSTEAGVISNGGLPSVKVDEASSWIERKGMDVVEMLQVFIQPFAIIMFIFGALMTLIGAIGNGKMVAKGLIAMMIASVMYAVVLFAPQLMDFFLAWVKE